MHGGNGLRKNSIVYHIYKYNKKNFLKEGLFVYCFNYLIFLFVIISIVCAMVCYGDITW